MTDEARLEAFARFEQEGWQQAAATYHDGLGALALPFAEPLVAALGSLEGRRLLDVASGPGYVAGLAAGRGADVVGIDFAEPMVEAARRLYPDVRFQVGDAESLPFQDAEFDAVTMGFAILHFPHPERALAEAFRVLRPGGVLAYTTWTGTDDGENASNLLRAVVAEYGDPTAVSLPEAPLVEHFAIPDRADNALREQGFVAPSIREVEVVAQLESPAQLIEMFSAGVRLATLLRGQTPEQMTAIRAALEQRLEPYRSESGYAAPMRAILATARKPTAA